MSGKNSGWEAYADLISHPHHISETHPQMSRQSRAAQFSSFAALTGLDAAMEEAGRVTDAKLDLDDSRKDAISRNLQLLRQRPELTCQLTYFVPDQRKSGGSYEVWTGLIQKIDPDTRMLTLGPDRRVPIDDVISLSIPEPALL